ncbi:MAG TPA: pentapeptide repeat-containing protein [Ktedonobacteraceae bacterium]|nr:pentapeptide repeat-containing protein [Ktedonobacteraceae bacterium]
MFVRMLLPDQQCEADLSEANLSGAYLERAYLRGASVAQDQLDQTRSLTNAHTDHPSS